MSRIAFKTGKPHQEKAAVWARRRLGDQSGRCFSSGDDQDGVLFADSVGLGKTWEALAAAALILCKANPQMGLRHILILCPANLVTKWEDELAASSPFWQALKCWVGKLKRSAHAKPAKVVAKTLAVVFPIRTARHVRTKRKHGRFHPHGGTYIISQNLFIRHAPGLAALRRQKWDIVIVDEAHNAAARKALDHLQQRRRAATKLLLTATPFQLEPRQMHSLTRNLVKHGQKVLYRPEVVDYIESLRGVFESEAATGPRPSAVIRASETLRKLAARTIPRFANRAYRVLLLNGDTRRLEGRLQSLNDRAVSDLLADLRVQAEETRDFGFEKTYFRERLRLAVGKEKTYVATRLRRFLARKSRRLQALELWAREAFREDIERSLEQGVPTRPSFLPHGLGDQRMERRRRCMNGWTRLSNRPCAKLSRNTGRSG